jgi:hypothetical protein
MFKLTILKHQTWSMTRWWTNLHTHHCKSRWCGGQGISASTFSQHQCSLTGVLPNYAHEGTTTATSKHIKFFDCTIVPEEKTYTTAHKTANSTFNATLWWPMQECILLHINLPKTQILYPLHRELDQNYHLTKTHIVQFNNLNCPVYSGCRVWSNGRRKTCQKLNKAVSSWCLIK